MTPALLILTDFFQAANRALDYATSLAQPLEARLVLLHVRRDSVLDPEMFTGQLSNLSREAIDLALRSVAGNLAVPVVAEVGHGRVAYAVADAVSRHRPTLVVLGRPDYSHTPDELVHTTALDILRAAPYPMLVVPHSLGAVAAPKRLLLAVDGGEFSLGEHAASIRQLLTALQPELTVLRVTAPDQPTTDQAALDSVESTGLTIDLRRPLRTLTPEASSPAAGILATAQPTDYDMVAIIARRRSFLGSLFHRSVTAHVLLHSQLPVLVLPAE